MAPLLLVVHELALVLGADVEPGRADHVSMDTAKIARLNMRNIRLAGLQAIFQLVIILIMAHLAVFDT